MQMCLQCNVPTTYYLDSYCYFNRQVCNYVQTVYLQYPITIYPVTYVASQDVGSQVPFSLLIDRYMFAYVVVYVCLCTSTRAIINTRRCTRRYRFRYLVPTYYLLFNATRSPMFPNVQILESKSNGSLTYSKIIHSPVN